MKDLFKVFISFEPPHFEQYHYSHFVTSIFLDFMRTLKWYFTKLVLPFKIFYLPLLFSLSKWRVIVENQTKKYSNRPMKYEI